MWKSLLYADNTHWPGKSLMFCFVSCHIVAEACMTLHFNDLEEETGSIDNLKIYWLIMTHDFLIIFKYETDNELLGLWKPLLITPLWKIQKKIVQYKQKKKSAKSQASFQLYENKGILNNSFCVWNCLKLLNNVT